MSILYFIVMIIGSSIFGVILNKRLCAIVNGLQRISRQIDEIKNSTES